MMPAIVSIWIRELLRFRRRPPYSLSALAFPAILFLGADAIHASSFALIAGFTVLLATIAAVDDPVNEFLQGVHASPAPRIAIVLGKVMAALSVTAINIAVLFLLSLMVRHP